MCKHVISDLKFELDAKSVSEQVDLLKLLLLRCLVLLCLGRLDEHSV